MSSTRLQGSSRASWKTTALGSGTWTGPSPAARAAGAATALLPGDPAAPAAAHADLHVLLATGPEVITGSTRMKAGTAQKLALNAFSTALMVRTGRTWSNLMVTASARNGKLRARAVRTLVTACQVTPEQAADCLDRCAGETATALVALGTGASPARSRAALAATGEPAARAITDAAADHLAALVRATARPGHPLVLSGSVATADGPVRTRLLQLLADLDPLLPRTDAATAAARLAAGAP